MRCFKFDGVIKRIADDDREKNGRARRGTSKIPFQVGKTCSWHWSVGYTNNKQPRGKEYLGNRKSLYHGVRKKKER